MTPPNVLDIPARAIAHVGRLMLARGMTDVAGGNISVRQGDRVFMTPRYAGHRWHWDLAPTDVLAFELDGRLVDGAHEPSRDLAVHLAAYAAAPEAGAVVHAHAPHALAFAAAGRAIPPVTIAADELGTVELLAIEWPDVDDEAAAIGAFAASARARIAAFAAAVLIPRHGIVVIGRDLAHAYDGLERAESCARAALLGRLLDQPERGGPVDDAVDEAIDEAIGAPFVVSFVAPGGPPTTDLLAVAPSRVNGSASATE